VPRFGISTALSLVVNTVLMFLDTLPEPGRLALVGICLISGALLLRKILIRVQPVLDPARKADAQLK
jgi:hypothetical protein